MPERFALGQNECGIRESPYNTCNAIGIHLQLQTVIHLICLIPVIKKIVAYFLQNVQFKFLQRIYN